MLLSRVVLLETKRMLRETLSLIIERDPGLELIGSHAELDEARAACEREQPDVILVDPDLAGGGGIEAIRRLQTAAPEASFLVITDEENAEVLSAAESLGAAGFYSKSQPTEDLLDLIGRVAAGEIVRAMPIAASAGAGPGEAEDLTTEDRGGEDLLVASLTPREREVLRAMSQGKSTGTIATALGISPLTVKAHVKSILAKLGVHS